MIVSGLDSVKAFSINYIKINGMDVSEHFVDMSIEESLFSPFLKGNIKLSNLILVIPPEWTNPELGFLNRSIEIEWNSDVIENLVKYKRTFKGIIYSIAEDTVRYVHLSFVQTGMIEYLVKQFCDGWENTTVSTIINNIFNNVVYSDKKPEMNFVDCSEKITFTNPNWTPVKACNFLLPMMSWNYVLYTSSNNKLNCVPINNLLNGEIIESLNLIGIPEDENTKIISEILDFQMDKKANNIIEQILNNTLGSNLTEYDVYNKSIKSININNNISRLKQLGINSSLISDKNGVDMRSSFSLSGLNAENVETNYGIKEFLNRTSLTIMVYGFSSRTVGTILDINLAHNNRFFKDYRNEISGKNLITEVIHSFSNKSYLQKIKLVKTGLGQFKEKEVSL